MTIDHFVEFFRFCHSTDQPCWAIKRCEYYEANQEKDAAGKAVQLLDSKTLQPTTMTMPQNFPENKIKVAHARAVCMACCGNPALITTGTTQTIASPQSLPPITLKIKPLEIEKVTAKDTIVVASTQKAAHVVVMIPEIEIASQLLITTLLYHTL